MNEMPGLFAMGRERISEPTDLGNLVRAAPTTGASVRFSGDARDSCCSAGSHPSQAERRRSISGYASTEAVALPTRLPVHRGRGERG